MPARTLSGAPVRAAVLTRPRQVTCAFLGDSLTSGALSTYAYGDAYPAYVTTASQGRIIHSGFYGVGGQRSDQILQRVQQALATRPTYLAVLAGTNDIGQGISTSKTDAQILDALRVNLRAMYRVAESIGTVPIAITIPPNNDSSNGARRQILILKANLWIRRHAIIQGYPLVDFYNLTVKDGVSATPAGNWKDLYANDGTHPNIAGCAAMGALFAQVINGTAASSTTPLTAGDTVDQSQALYLLRNPLFSSATGDPKKPDTFSAYGSPTSDTNTVYSLVTDSVLPGRLQQIAMSSSATNQGGLASSNFATAKGDLIAIAGHFTTDGVTSLQVQLLLGGSTYRPLYAGANASPSVDSPPISRGMYYMEVVAPAASTANSVNLFAGLRSGKAATAAFSYPTVVNLTQLFGETSPITPN